MPSLLPSTLDRSSVQLRASSTQDNWGGDETVTLSVLQSALPVRVEWIEGVGDRWDIWVFDEAADIQTEDVMLVESLGLALTVTRVGTFTNLKGVFHHREIVTEEHEHSVADLKTAAGI